MLEVAKEEEANKLRGKERPRRKERSRQASNGKQSRLDLEEQQRSRDERAIGCMIVTVLSSGSHRKLQHRFTPKMWVSDFTLRLGNAASLIDVDVRLHL